MPHSPHATLPPSPFALLDFARSGAAERGLLFRDPVRVLVAERLEDVGIVLGDAEKAVAAGHHVVGFVSYEAAPAFDPALAVRARTSLPLAWFGIFAAPEPAFALEAENIEAPAWSADTSEEAHAAALGGIHDAIGRGEVYQVNHTLRLRAGFDGDPLALYQRMRAAQPSGYCAYFDIGRHCILSASPELFFERRGDTITTRPMKGTARRGRWTEEDDAAAHTLVCSGKERAENVMVVDLLRNDIGRVAKAGTVNVAELFAVERHPTVLQMTSTIEAELAPRTTLRDIFAALFPCGSITGAPKVAAMKKIAMLEPSPRGVYCGAIGHLTPSGDATFNVAIRTAWLDRDTRTIEYGVGGGITWDSAASAEYDEIRAKSAIVTSVAPSFDLLETMRLTGKGYARRERHLARLADSARYFGIPLEMREVEHALDAHARDTQSSEFPRRVRLLVARDGTPRVEDRALPADALSGAPQRMALATLPVASSDPFLFHKTTHRAVYDRHRAEHPDAFDVLLWNENGELTEFTIGNLVLRLDGVDWTPPRECGLLAGTYRAELLERGEIRERRLHIDDLERAEGIWLVNSLRGRVPMTSSDFKGSGLLKNDDGHHRDSTTLTP